MYRLFARPGWGSALIETQLAWYGLPYEIEDLDDLFKSTAARELDRARPCVTIGKFDAGCQTDPFAHRRQREPALGITHRVAKRGIAAHGVMHVIATFYR